MALLVSCGPANEATSEQSTGPLSPAPAAVKVPDELLPCNLQPFGEGSLVIGPAGGTLQVGRHSLTVPPGALDAEVLISGRAPEENMSSVAFEPEGLHFLLPVTLTLDYSHCPFGKFTSLKRVAYTSDLLGVLQLLRGRDNPPGAQIATEIEHFSRYAVAW